MNALTRDLAALLSTDAVSDEPADRGAYAHDLWPRQLIATRGGLPRPAGPAAIAWPTDREQISKLVGYARQHGVKLVPFGAGSAVTGALCLEDDVVALDLKRMRTLHAVDVDAGTAVADAGMLGEHLEQQLGRRGATLGHFPSSIACSTLGGWLATRSAGQCSGRYGKIEDMVLSMDGVLASGEPFRCGPPEPGAIDARALLVGSEGLFGFLTRATMRVWPAPATRRFAALSFDTMEHAWDAIRVIYQAGLRPAVARLYDAIDTYIFRSGGRAHGPRVRSAGAARPVSEFVLRHVLPRARTLNALNNALGEAVFGRSLLVLVFEATASETTVDAALLRATALARAGGGRDEGEALARRWLARRHAVSYRQPPTFARGLWVDTMEVAAPWSRLGALYQGVRAALGDGGFVMAHMSHAYPDGCSIYFTFAGADPTDDRALARYLATWSRALEAAHHAGGTIAHHHGIGRSKRGAMRLELAGGVEAISALARGADPHGVMAPGPLIPRADDPWVPEPRDTEQDAMPRGPVALDAVSRLATLDPDATLDTVHAALRGHGLALPAFPPSEGARTVREWLSRGAAAALADPSDHVVAGYAARLASGAFARVLPCPRRAAGPDLFPLFACSHGRHGELLNVTVRVVGADETGPRWTAPFVAPAREVDPVIAAWLDRVAM